MGLMASVTEHARIVVRGRHLRETARFGGIFLVATDTKRGHVGECGFGGHGVAALGVYGLRPVASFTGDMRMLARGTRVCLIGVTNDALRLPAEDHWPRPNQIQGRRPVVAVPAKAFGDHGLANQ